MAELKDYRGEFNPDIEFEDFDKEACVRLAKAYMKLYQLMDARWYQTIEPILGWERALGECEVPVWKALGRDEPREICKALNIEGNDVATFFKYMQFIPGAFRTHYQIKYEFVDGDKNHGIMTVEVCPTLDWYEKKGYSDEWIKKMCEVEYSVWPIYAKFFNPDIEMTCLKIPPRKSSDEIACKWDVKVVPKA